MKIGIWNLERKIVNSAMMRVSKYHKEIGDEVLSYVPMFHEIYDKVYVFSIFDFTPKPRTITNNMIVGGTGFNIFSKLPKEIEDANYDWSLYPKCDHSLIWFSTGCIYKREKHPFCPVVDKEGYMQPIEPKNLNPNGSWIKVMDNNFFGNPDWKDAIKQLQDWGQPCDFQGVDARKIGKTQCESLLTLKHKKRIKIAWDDPRENMPKHFKRIIKYIKAYKLMSYVLIGFWSTEKQDVMRVETLRKLNIDPFVMPYDKFNPYQMGFSRYVNRKAEFKSQTWLEYKTRKGIPDGAK